MIQLTDNMKRLVNNAREDGFPCIVATSSPDGTPNAGYIGTVLAVDDSTFIYRDRTRRMPLEHLEENPRSSFCFAMLRWTKAGSSGAPPAWSGRERRTTI